MHFILLSEVSMCACICLKQLSRFYFEVPFVPVCMCTFMHMYYFLSVFEQISIESEAALSRSVLVRWFR